MTWIGKDNAVAQDSAVARLQLHGRMGRGCVVSSYRVLGMLKACSLVVKIRLTKWPHTVSYPGSVDFIFT